MELMRREALNEERLQLTASAQHDDVVVAPPTSPGPAASSTEQPRAHPPAIPDRALCGLGQPLLPLAVHPLGKHVLEFAEALPLGGGQCAHDEACKFATEYWSPRSNVWHSSSIAARQMCTPAGGGGGAKKIRRDERRLSAAAELAERELQHNSQLAIAAPCRGVKLVAFVESAKSDEATSVLGVVQPVDQQFLGDHMPTDNLPNDLVAFLEADGAKETVPAKLFQTETCWGAVLAKEGTDASQPAEFVLITSEQVSAPQVLQRTTAECIARALQMSSTVRPQTVSDFKWKMRLICSDRYEAQVAAERGLASLRGDAWQKLHLGCEVHMSTKAQIKGLGLLGGAVGRMIRFALSLRLGRWMREFRRCLFLEVCETLEVLEGASTEAATLHRRRALTGG